MREVVIHLDRLDAELSEILHQLEHPEDALAQIGALYTAQAQKAFRDQQFDDQPWAKRYAGQEEPFINLAGTLDDFSKGSRRKPKARRFDRTPAGIDTRILFNSLAPGAPDAVKTVGAYTVEVGSSVPYASKVMCGGESTQPITEETKRKVVHFAESPEGAPFAKHLSRLTGEKTTELATEVHPRPFLGTTEKLKAKIVAVVEGNIGEAMESGG